MGGVGASRVLADLLRSRAAQAATAASSVYASAARSPVVVSHGTAPARRSGSAKKVLLEHAMASAGFSGAPGARSGSAARRATTAGLPRSMNPSWPT